MVNISNLTFGYGKQKLFQNISLELKAGHIYGLLGKNGAGKSTLLKSIAGLIFPKEGTCVVNGFSSKKRIPNFLQEVFFLPEDIYLPSVNAKQFAENTGCFYPNFNANQYFKLLHLFNINETKELDHLSFGQQKKVMIAFGLSTNTSLLIMDEPTNGLDIPSKSQFRKVIASSLNEDRCIVISTHQVRDLDNLIDRILVLHDHQIVLNRSIDEIAEKVSFGVKATSDATDIYIEETIKGLNVISLNEDENYSKVDMELLFNAIINNNQSLTEIFK
nr:ATP-binding cassette domain-containing protein [Pseudopedobacter sp.]